MILNSKSRVGNKVKLPSTTDSYLKDYFFIVCDKEPALVSQKKLSGATMFFALLPIDHTGGYDIIRPIYRQYVFDNNGKSYGVLGDDNLPNYVYDYFKKGGNNND